MGTFYDSGTLSNASDAAFRVWVNRVHTALIACGLVRTDDTGQIDTSTCAVPTTINTYAGSSIWRFNDNFQTTTPIFIKIDFGTSSTVGYPAMRVSIGPGSNGSGALTSAWLSNLAVLTTSGSTTSSFPWYASGGDGRMVLVMSIGSPQTQGAICIERGRDESGNVIDDDVRILIGLKTTPYWNGAYIKPSNNYIFGPIYPLASSPSSGNGSFNNDVALYPIRIASPAETTPLVSIVAYFTGNITAGYTVTARGWDGIDHVFMPCGGNIGSTPTYGGSTVIAVLYE